MNDGTTKKLTCTYKIEPRYFKDTQKITNFDIKMTFLARQVSK